MVDEGEGILDLAEAEWISPHQMDLSSMNATLSHLTGSVNKKWVWCMRCDLSSAK